MTISRRDMLTLPLVLLVQPSVARGYSSPYSPSSSTPDAPLPAPLYTTPVVTLSSGVRYFDLSTGMADARVVREGDVVLVYYTSRLSGLNGIKLESSYDNDLVVPCPIKVGDMNVVPGVSQALIGMREGAKRRALVPENMAYKSVDMVPKVTGWFGKRRLKSVLETKRDAGVVFDLEVVRIK